MTAIPSAEPSLAFDDVGTGPALLLGHSFLCDRTMWRYQVPVWSRKYRVINPDLRGHGESGRWNTPVSLDELVDDSLRLLDRLAIDQAAWVGLSIGGMTAMRAALQAPDRVSALVLLDTDAGPETPYRRLEYRILGVVAGAVGIGPLMPRVLRQMFGATSLRERPELLAEWSRKMATAHIPSMRAILRGLVARRSLLDRLVNLTVPTLVLCGAEDTSTPPSRSRQIAGSVGGSELHFIPRAGHLSALEQPQEVADLTMGFLEKNLGG